MSSFRAILAIGQLRDGHAPEEVMSVARASLQEAAGLMVEATDIRVVAGTPQIVLRFAVPPSTDEEENETALAAGVAMREAVAEVAEVGALQVLRRVRDRWKAINL